MSLEENTAVVRRLLEEVFNRGALSVVVVDELWTEGRAEEGKRVVTRWRTTFPDYHRTIESQVGEGDLVATRWTMRGTHQGVYERRALGRAIEPTGKRVEVRGMSMRRVSGGWIVEAWVVGQTDRTESLERRGVFSPSGAGSS